MYKGLYVPTRIKNKHKDSENGTSVCFVSTVKRVDGEKDVGTQDPVPEVSREIIREDRTAALPACGGRHFLAAQHRLLLPSTKLMSERERDNIGDEVISTERLCFLNKSPLRR